MFAFKAKKKWKSPLLFTFSACFVKNIFESGEQALGGDFEKASN